MNMMVPLPDQNMPNTERLLGNLEAGLVGVNEKLDMLLDVINRVESDYKESILRLERDEASARGRIYERIEREAGGNQEAFRTFRETLTKLNDHMVRFEQTSDLTEGHAAALLDHEGRIKHIEDNAKNLMARSQQNKLWIRSLVAGAGLLETLHLGGGKLIEWVKTLK